MLPGPILPGRDCDGCDVCCVVLTIDEKALRKAQGVPCRYLRARAEGGRDCTIHAGRPGTCRAFQCGWRQLRWVDEGLRPDRSGLLIRLHEVPVPGEGREQVTVVFTVMREGAVEAPGCAEAVAASIAAGLEVYLEVPGPPGYTAAMARIDEALGGLVRARDRAGLVEALREGYRAGLRGKRTRVRVGG